MSSSVTTSGFLTPTQAVASGRVSWTGWLRLMLHAIETRRQLAAMDDRMLSDIGFSRLEALHEVGRAPWDLAPPAR